MIYTLDWLDQEAKAIQAAWNGEDESFVYEGERLPMEMAEAAKDLENKLKEVRELVEELGL